MSTPRQAADEAPDYVKDLQAVYGPPSDAGFGSAVFFEPTLAEDDFEAAARDNYERFVGESWTEYGESVWMSTWKRVYVRKEGNAPDVVAELRGMTDEAALSAASLMLDASDHPDQARKALAAAMDGPSVSRLEAYTLGDGEAMSGLLVAGRRENGEATFVVLLMD